METSFDGGGRGGCLAALGRRSWRERRLRAGVHAIDVGVDLGLAGDHGVDVPPDDRPNVVHRHDVVGSRHDYDRGAVLPADGERVVAAGRLFREQDAAAAFSGYLSRSTYSRPTAFERARASLTSALEGDTCRRAAVGVLCSVVLIP